MNRVKYVLSFATLSVLLFAACQWGMPKGDELKREQLLLEVIRKNIEAYHFAPQDMDDAFSMRLFDLFLARLDNGKRFFLKSEIDAFKKSDRVHLDDEIRQGTFTFFDKAYDIYRQRIILIDTFYREILAQPFDFEKSEHFETDADKIDFVDSEAALKDRWRKYLKWQVLTRVHNRMENQAEAQKKAKEEGKAPEEVKDFATLEAEARKSVLKNYKEWSKRLSLEEREDYLNIYFNAFTNAVSPHTNFFPPIDKENFDIRMSGKLEGIGAQLTQEEGYTKVVNIVPGSASDLQGDLEENDKIIKVAQEDEEPVDIVDMKLNDVLPLIRGKKGTKVRLTVMKQNGSIKEIPIVRDVVIMEENYAKSALITHDEQAGKIGLIDLRSFYLDFNDPNGRNSYVDVKKEVAKLIDEDVKGIIIDLRFNGGGSLNDVIKMVGLFIPRGPVVQVKARNNRPQVMSDTDKRVLYDGPLVILVNSFSASASEIMAAALQDYGRAIIIGTSPSTFGKGTVQRVFDLDQVVPASLKYLGQLGSAKITTQKFYRINGDATQLKGVHPDIALPGIYDQIALGERESEYPLPFTSIKPAEYKKSNHINSNKLMRIKRRSARRVAKNDAFARIQDNAAWIKSQQDDTVQPLQYTAYKAHEADIETRAKDYDKIMTPIEGLHIQNLPADEAALSEKEETRKRRKNWHKNLAKDIYLEEAIHVIHDLD